MQHRIEVAHSLSLFCTHFLKKSTHLSIKAVSVFSEMLCLAKLASLDINLHGNRLATTIIICHQLLIRPKASTLNDKKKYKMFIAN